ncbi:MAG: hypothetical protein KJ607_01960 [Bacteroidetes bacterium]|nr:hypothetical protein [Bacteroidota bacterium]
MENNVKNKEERTVEQLKKVEHEKDAILSDEEKDEIKKRMDENPLKILDLCFD